MLNRRHVLPRVALALLLGAAMVWFFLDRQFWPRGEALHAALQASIDRTNTNRSIVAQSVWDNYLEARTNATWWSGVYFGFTFLAAGLSALAGLILKFEFIVKQEALKKDLAAIFSVCAALLITVSTSGDFQRKWQANRIAAAELERLGYELLENESTDARLYFPAIGKALHDRHLSIVGSGGAEQARPLPPAASTAVH